ncbi:MAG: aspartoacylase, partial [Cyanobacteriota bacterium]|nr:aspartoacylase [Cyanobacteriota bacterium]
MDKINRVAILGGTHGNEFTGAYLVKKFERFPNIIKRPSFETIGLLGNPEAFKAVRRYLDKDLNRCFTRGNLENNQSYSIEDKRAKFINNKLGNKGNPSVDFLLDLHSTTANMGLTIILVNNNYFNFKIAAYLSSIWPEIKVYSAVVPGREMGFVNSICDRGFAIEVGPIAQGILSGSLFEKTEKLAGEVLDCLEKFNRGEIGVRSLPLTIYRHLKTVDFPKNERGELDGTIHPQLEGRDYQQLS